MRLQRKRLPAMAGVVITFLFLILALQPQGASRWLSRLDYLLYDWRFTTALAIKPTPVGEQPIVIIDIDEQSLAQEGRWPWSRHKLAELVAALAGYGVTVAAFDVVFSEPERNPVDEIRQRLLRDGEDWKAPAHWRRQVDGDQHFAEELPATDVVLGFFFLDEALSVGQLPEAIDSLAGSAGDSLVVVNKPGYAANLPLLQSAAAGGGFVTTFADSDGAIRRSPLLIRHDGQLYPSLSLATLMAYLFDRNVTIDTARIGSVDAIRHITLSGLKARTDASGWVTVPYRGGRRTFPYIPAADVLSGRADTKQLEGAIVLVGTSALGLSDLRATPVGTQYPGVEVHANIIDAMLNDGFPYRPEWEAGATAAALCLIGLVLAFWLPAAGPVASIMLSGAAALLVVAGNLWLWIVHRLDLPMASLLLMVGSLTMMNMAWGFIRESVSRRVLKGMFDQYVPPAHIDRMLADPAAYQFAGESKDMTVLFSDIRSFTSMSENLTASELKALLNSYFTPVTKVIFDHEGTIDKYVGDMVMAFWGAPLDDAQHAHHAVAAALKMQETTVALSADFVARGWPPVAIGIGINTGPMNVGDMGSSYRRAYTVLGDSVNLGSRLESITKYYGAKILVSEMTKAQAPGFVYRFVDRIQVKGKNEPVSVFEPLCTQGLLSSTEQHELQNYHAMIEAYRSQNWQQALVILNGLQNESDRLLYQVYRQRIESLQQNPPAEGWDGVFRHTEK